MRRSLILFALLVVGTLSLFAGHTSAFADNDGRDRDNRDKKTVVIHHDDDDNNRGNNQRGNDRDRDRRENERRDEDRRRHGTTVVREYRIDGTTPFTQTVCGVTFTGTLEEHQKYQLLSNGILNFKYTATVKAEGTDSNGNRVVMTIKNFEIDKIIAETPPDLAPYGGSLPAWVEANLDIIIEIKSGFEMKIKGRGEGSPKLINKWTFRAEHSGIKVNKIKFEATNCP